MSRVSEFKKQTNTVEIPQDAGLEGLILLLRRLLKLPKMVDLTVSALSWSIKYTRYVRDGEEESVDLELDTVSPAGIVRRCDNEEVLLGTSEENAPKAVCLVLLTAQREQFFPIAWATGRNSIVHTWHEATCGLRVFGNYLYGLPVVRDINLPDDSLLLLCGAVPDAELIDAKKAYKITMPHLKLDGRVDVPALEEFMTTSRPQNARPFEESR